MEVKLDDTFVEINPEYAYLVIPTKYICTYHKILIYLADFGKRLLDDCSASCKGNNKTIVDCWNLFQSALACYTLGHHKQADLFIDYINKQLECIYRGEEDDVWSGTIYLPITPDGKLKALVSCVPDSKFYVDPETAILYQHYLDKHVDEFAIDENGQLTVKTENC